MLAQSSRLTYVSELSFQKKKRGFTSPNIRLANLA